MIAEPSGADPVLQNEFYNQICTAASLRNADIDEESKTNKASDIMLLYTYLSHQP